MSVWEARVNLQSFTYFKSLCVETGKSGMKEGGVTQGKTSWARLLMSLALPQPSSLIIFHHPPPYSPFSPPLPLPASSRLLLCLLDEVRSIVPEM